MGRIGQTKLTEEPNKGIVYGPFDLAKERTRRKAMDSRERTLLAINHEAPDRVPIDFWASRGMIRKIESALSMSYADFLDSADVDLRYIAGPEYIGPPLDSDSDGTVPDIWGVPRKVIQLDAEGGGVETYEEVTMAPLANASTIDEILAYSHWPSPDWFRYDGIEKQCEAIRDKGRAVVFMGDRLNRVAQLKPAMYLRGVEQIFMDLAMEPGIARAIFDKIRSFYIEYLTRILESANGKIDIVLTGDDFGSQNGLLLSPAMWDEYLREGFAQYLGLIRQAGAKSMHHTCGSVQPLLPRMIECGLDVLQALQPEAHDMSLRDLKARFGMLIAFQGGISIQDTLPFGKPGDVAQAVQEVAETAAPGGGYIFCTSHNIQADAPIENVQALVKAYHQYGRY